MVVKIPAMVAEDLWLGLHGALWFLSFRIKCDVAAADLGACQDVAGVCSSSG